MKTNKVQIILIVLSLIGAIVGVFMFASFQGPPPPKITTAQTITLWGTLPEKLVEPVVSSFKAEFGSEIVYEEKDSQRFENDLIDALASNSGPDAILTDANWVHKNKNKLSSAPATLLNPTDMQSILTDGAYSASTEITKQKDNNNKEVQTTVPWFMPLWADPLVLYWNKDLFNAASVPLPPATWTEFLETSNTLKKLGQGDLVLRAGSSLGRAKNIPLHKQVQDLILLQQGVQFERDMLLSATEEARSRTESALRFYTDFGRQGSLAYTWNTTLPEPRRLFIDNNLGMMIDYTSYQKTLQEKNPHLAFGIALTPSVQNASKKIYTANFAGVAVLKGSKNTDDAWRFAIWMAGQKRAEVFMKNLSVAPVRRDLLTSSELSSLLRESSLNAYMPRESFSEQTSLVVSQMIEDIASGQKTVSEGITQAKSRFDALIKGR